MQNANRLFLFRSFARHHVCAAGLCMAWLLPTSLTHAQPSVASTEATTSSAASETHAELRGLLPQHKLQGRGRLKVWGFEVYDASLWVTPDFRADRLTAVPFALEVAYLRDFTNTDIIERSIAEMRRSATISDAQEKAWTAAMLRVIPNVKKGDRILGIYRPGTGASFLVNGQAAGDIMDVEFAGLFFGIWLSPKTSVPKVRSALLAGAA
jgi:Chalcone isomerase-like